MFWMCLSAMNKVFIETSVHLKKIQSKNSQLSLCLSLHHTHFDYLITPPMGSGSGFWFEGLAIDITLFFLLQNTSV